MSYPANISDRYFSLTTSEYEDDEVEKFYDTIEEILEEDGRVDTNSIILGDWNSVVGEDSYKNIVGSHGLGRRNYRGQIYIDFCERNGLIVTNTWFKKPKRRLYMEGTWRLESISAGLHPGAASIQKQCEGCADIAWGRY